MSEKYLVIENDAEVDFRAFTLMGASTKREDSTKIGFFGSGNKYAIATLMRKEIPFRIFSGKKEILFQKKGVYFAERKYDLITVNGEETSLTTEMGPDWKEWFAIREFYSNAVDEGNATFSVTEKISPENGKTKIYVSETEELKEFFTNVKEYLLPRDYPRVASINTYYGVVSLIEKMNNSRLIFYRKGIRAEERRDNCLYWYDFDNIEINESRIIKYSHQSSERIASFFAESLSRDIINNFINNHLGKYEENLYWEYASPLSKTWKQVISGIRILPMSVASMCGDKDLVFNSIVLPDKLAKKISQEIPEAVVVGYSSGEKYRVLDMFQSESLLIKNALEIMKRMGYDYVGKVVVAEFYTKDTIAVYEPQCDCIALSRKHFPATMRELMVILIEEYFHSKGYTDSSRSFIVRMINEVIDKSGVIE